MKDLTIFVLGHEKEAIKKTSSILKEKSFLKIVPVNLNDLELPDYPEKYNSKFLSENRFFLCDQDIQTEYVGLISHSWPKKYNRFNLKIVPDRVLQSIDKNKVIAPATTNNWLGYTEESHPGMYCYLEELASFMNYKNWNCKITFWCNTFFCHRDAYYNFIKDWRLMFNYLHLRYQMNFNYGCVKEYSDYQRKPAYILERATMMHFSESSLEVEQYNCKLKKIMKI